MRKHRENLPERRRCIEAALVRLFAERPEYKARRVGQVTCQLLIGGYVAESFPRGAGGVPKDSEVESILDGVAA